MTPTDSDIDRRTHLWLERYGDQAVPMAREMVAAMQAKNDAAGADEWLRIIVALEEELRRRSSRPAA